MSSDSPQPKTAVEWIDRHLSIGEFERVGYVGLGERYNKCLYRLRRRHFLRLARSLGVGPQMRALDVGCGTGFYVELLQTLGVRDITGVDISPDAVERLRAHFDNCRFAVADLTAGLPADLEQPAGNDARWHVVTAMDVLFHITEDELFDRALQHCAAAVASGGLLLVSDNFPIRRLPADASQAYRTMDDHLRVLHPLGFKLRTLSPVFFVSNGQVPGGGFASRVAAWKWRWFARGLGKLIRTTPRLGEMAGGIAGELLTSIDVLMQRQSRIRGYSTKVAVFRRSD